ncbi:MAG: hypothetical protein EAZ51_01615 [Sphingobacteriales bacterium]|nr:MAG: hypothetical protein EAZ51_01615 [Sphingobacteriales bacterium]
MRELGFFNDFKRRFCYEDAFFMGWVFGRFNTLSAISFFQLPLAKAEGQLKKKDAASIVNAALM